MITFALAGSLPAMTQTTYNHMGKIEVCKQNFHTLFGGEALTGQNTSPEMMNIPAEVHLWESIPDGQSLQDLFLSLVYKKESGEVFKVGASIQSIKYKTASWIHS